MMTISNNNSFFPYDFLIILYILHVVYGRKLLITPNIKPRTAMCTDTQYSRYYNILQAENIFGELNVVFFLFRYMGVTFPEAIHK